MRVLDLDMDYFMTEIASTPLSCEVRLDEEYYGDSVWTEEEVRQFLEQNLGLSKNHKISGRIVTGHNEALIFWKELINSILTYEMEFIYKDWYRRPIDKLYSFISDTYFSGFQNDRCFIAHGLMASVHPV